MKTKKARLRFIITTIIIVFNVAFIWQITPNSIFNPATIPEYFSEIGTPRIARDYYYNQTIGSPKFPHVPASIAINSTTEHMYIMDSRLGTIFVTNPMGELITKWGVKGSEIGQFNNAQGIALNRSEYVYIADSSNNRVQVFSPAGHFLTAWGSAGSEDGNFTNPTDIAVNATGYVYVADSGNNRIQVFTQSGQFLFKWGEGGSGAGQFNGLTSIEFDSNGLIYTVNTLNNFIEVFNCYGTYIISIGLFQLTWPHGIAINSTDYIYVTEPDMNQVKVFSSGGTLVNTWGSGGSGEGQFSNPSEIAVNSSGQIYVGDDYNRVQVFTETGQFLLQEGRMLPREGEIGDSSYEQSGAWAIAVNKTGTVYVADTYNDRVEVFTSTGQFLMKWGSHGAQDGNFTEPRGIAVNESGAVYVTDMNNHRVQVFSSTGQFLFKWGDYGPEAGNFSYPHGIAVNGSGNIYIIDSNNHRVQVFSQTGLYLFEWGTSGSDEGYFSYPIGIAVNKSGHIYVADTNNNRVQVFTSTGQFLFKWGATGDQDGYFQVPHYIAIDCFGGIYVTDCYNNRVQAFTQTGQFLCKWGIYGVGAGEFVNPNGIAINGTNYIFISEYGGYQRIQMFEPAVIPIEAPVLTAISPNPTYDGNVTVQWEVVSGATNYSLYRYGGYITDLNESVINIANVTGLTYNDTILASGIYYYVVVAFNVTSISPISNCLSVAATPPAAPSLTGIIPYPTFDGNVMIQWDGATGADNYTVFRYGGYITELNSSLTTVTTTASLTCADALPAAGTYYYVVIATSRMGNSTLSTCLSVAATPPAAPSLTGIIPYLTYDGNVTIRWSSVTYADNYTVFRYDGYITVLNGSVTNLTTTTDLSFNDTLLATGTYYYALIATSRIGDSTLSTCLSVVATPPATPTMLTITPYEGSPGVVVINWESATGATNYSLYRYTSYITEINNSVQLLILDNILQFKDTLTISGVYYYVVIASGPLGNSTISNCLDVTVEIPPAIDYVSILLWVGIAIAITACIVIPVRRSRLNRDSMPTRRQQPQKKVPERVRSQFLEQVKASILAAAEFKTGILSFTGKWPIPTHRGVPVVSDGDISNLVQGLAMDHHLEGMVWNDVFYSDAAMLNILKSLAENHNEISIDDLVGKVPEIDPRGIKILLKHLLESHQLPYILDLQRNILKFKLPVDPSTLKILIGIVRIDKNIDLNKASEVLRLPKARIIELIDMLKRDGIVEGEYDGEIFRIRSDVGKFIEDLNRQFHLWNDPSGTKKE